MAATGASGLPPSPSSSPSQPDGSAARELTDRAAEHTEYTVDELHQAVRAVALARDLGPLALYTRTAVLRERAFALLDRHERSARAPDLYAGAGWLCTLLAWFAADLGRYDHATAQARTAMLCAERAGHDELYAWSRAAMSSAAYWRGDVPTAAGLAEDGLRHAHTGTVGVLLAGMAAVGWAQCGRSGAASTALDSAREMAARGATDAVGGFLACPPERQHGYAGGAHLWLASPERALLDFDAALDALADRSVMGRSWGTEPMVRADMARAHLLVGELDPAADVLEPVFALPVDLRHAPVVERLGLVAELLAGARFGGAPAVPALRARIEEFRLYSLPRTLPA